MGDVRIPDLNQVTIAGRIGHDLELKYSSSGAAFLNLRIVNTEHYKDKQGNKQEKSVWLGMTVWDKQAKWLAEHLAKGRPVLCTGKLKEEKWTDKTSGQERSKIVLHPFRVVPLDWNEDSASGTNSGSKYQEAPKHETPPPQQSAATDDMDEDDIPF